MNYAILKNNQGFSILSILVTSSFLVSMTAYLSGVMLNAQKGAKGIELSSEIYNLQNQSQMIIGSRQNCQNSGIVGTHLNQIQQANQPITLHYPTDTGMGAVFLAEGQVLSNRIEVVNLRLHDLQATGPARTAGMTNYLAKLRQVLRKPTGTPGVQELTKEHALNLVIENASQNIVSCSGTESLNGGSVNTSPDCDWDGIQAGVIPGNPVSVCRNGKITRITTRAFIESSCTNTHPKGYTVTMNVAADGRVTLNADFSTAPHENHQEATLLNATFRSDQVIHHQTCQSCYQYCSMFNFNNGLCSPACNCIEAADASIQIRFDSATGRWTLETNGKFRNNNAPYWNHLTCTAGGFDPNL